MSLSEHNRALDLRALKNRLQNLDRRGGLGYEAHEIVRDTINTLDAIARAEGVAALQQAGEPVAFELGAFKSWTGGADVVSYIARYGGMCRGCADEHGICPGSGLPCDDVEKPIRHVLEALSYGLRHGYITLPQQTALVEGGAE